MTLSEQTWVLTGAAGRVASGLREGLAARVGRLRLLDVVHVEPRYEREEAAVVDVRDQPALDVAVSGADGVVHLGGLADEGDFHDLAEVNIVGTYHVLEAARRGGAARVVYASSNRVTGFYPTTTVVDADMPPRPDSLYAVSKVAGEALARLYAEKFGLQVASVRIGSFEEAPGNNRHLSTWVSPKDCLAAVVAAMTAPGLTYATFYAVSRNTRRWWDLGGGHRLGFDPADDAEEHAGAVEALPPLATPGGPQSAQYTDPDYTLARQRQVPGPPRP